MEKVTEKLKNLNIDPKNIKGEYEAPCSQTRMRVDESWLQSRIVTKKGIPSSN